MAIAADIARKTGIEGDGHARMVGQHGDKMGRPDPASRHGAGPGQPYLARTPGIGGARAGDHGERGGAGEHAQSRRQENQAQVMLLKNATQHTDHRRILG